MIFLDRTKLKIPADWQQKVDARLPNPKRYRQKARTFEKLAINGARRRGGFTQYAPEVLKQSGDKASFPPVWSSDKRVKTALDKWSHGKCAYCETLINASRSQQVEHFKPKSLFPSLVYDWNNYFLACGGCNGTKVINGPKPEAMCVPMQLIRKRCLPSIRAAVSTLIPTLMMRSVR